MNSYALGRIVAGKDIASRFISACKSCHRNNVHYAFRRESQSHHMWPSDELASVAGLGVVGPPGPRDGISSGTWPGNSSGRGDSPGSCTGVISGCGLPGGMPGGQFIGPRRFAGLAHRGRDFRLRIACGNTGRRLGRRARCRWRYLGRFNRHRHHRDQLSGERQR